MYDKVSVALIVLLGGLVFLFIMHSRENLNLLAKQRVLITAQNTMAHERESRIDHLERMVKAAEKKSVTRDTVVKTVRVTAKPVVKKVVVRDTVYVAKSSSLEVYRRSELASMLKDCEAQQTGYKDRIRELEKMKPLSAFPNLNAVVVAKNERIRELETKYQELTARYEDVKRTDKMGCNALRIAYSKEVDALKECRISLRAYREKRVR